MLYTVSLLPFSPLFHFFTFHYLLPLSPSSPCFARLGFHHFRPAFRPLALFRRLLFLSFPPLRTLFCFSAVLRFPAFPGENIAFFLLPCEKNGQTTVIVYAADKTAPTSHAPPDRSTVRIFRRTAAAGIDRTWKVCYTDGKARQDRSGGHRVADPLPRCARHTEAYTGPLVGQGRPSTDKGSKRDALL